MLENGCVAQCFDRQSLARPFEHLYDRRRRAEQCEAAVEALHERAAVIAARLNRDHADLVQLTAEVLEDDRWGGGGFRSPEHWLIVRIGLSPARAKEMVRLARRREEVPATVALLTEGQVSFDQAAVVARLAPASHEASIAEQVAAAPAELAMGYDDTGRFQLRYDAPAAVGALVEQAVKEARDALFTAGQRDVTRADAVAEMASRSLAAVESPSRAAHYRVYVHLSTDGAWVNGGGAVPPSLAARFACDATVQPLWETDGRPVSVGRDQRIVPARTRRLIQDRDRGCRFPGCTATTFVEVHHLDPWSQGGATDIETNACLCPHHHDGLHRGDYSITGDPTRPDGLTFTGAGGLRIGALRPALPLPLPPDTRGDPSPWDGAAGERLDLSGLWFEPGPQLVDTG